ncbi:MAG: ATP-binding protein [Alphaproteobacteria bacterium]
MRRLFFIDSLWGRACITLVGSIIVSWTILLAWQFSERYEQSFAFQTESFGNRIQSLYENQAEFVGGGDSNPIRKNWVAVWPNNRKMMQENDSANTQNHMDDHMLQNQNQNRRQGQGQQGVGKGQGQGLGRNIEKGWKQEERLITRFTFIYITPEPLVKADGNNRVLERFARKDVGSNFDLNIKTVKKADFENVELNRMPPSQKLLLASVPMTNGEWLNITSPIIKMKGPNFSPLLLVVGLTSLMVVAFALYAIHRSLRPLAYIEKRAHTLGRNMAVEPLKVEGPRELRQVQMALNRMQESIQQNFENRTTLLAALSHDLKTPLTRLRLRAEFMEDDEEREKNLKNINDMEALIAEIMDFAKLQSGTATNDTVNFSALVESIVNDAQDAGQDVTIDHIANNLTIKGEGLAIKRAVNNLLDNALKYAGSAQIKLVQDGNYARLDVRDFGKGLSEEQLETLWQPFKRGEASRNRQSGGTGLGLASVRMIVESLGGEAKLQNCSEPQGLKASVWLPVIVKNKRSKNT